MQVHGFQPLQQGPPPAECALAAYLTSSLARLARFAADPSTAAADSAAHPPTSHPLPPSPSSGSSSAGGGAHDAGFMGVGLGLEPPKLWQAQLPPVAAGGGGSDGLAWTDVLLLARCICEHLGPLLVRERAGVVWKALYYSEICF